ncbi:MAG: DUF3054 domain-containing protein [Leucobacter sp.]
MNGVILPEPPPAKPSTDAPAQAPAAPTAPTGRPLLWAALSLLLDAALVVLFAGLGRSTHERDATVFGLFETAWPFLVGLLLVWGWGLVWKRPTAILHSGVPVWIGTVALGMGLRLLSGQGAAFPFVVVAVITLGVFLLGWRGIVALIRVRRRV